MVENIFEDEDERLTLDIPKEERHLNTSSYDYSVEFLIGLMQGDNSKIILEVPFQRKFIWKEDRRSLLIESIIMNVPIPPIYFAEEDDGRWLVVDGLQRLNSLLSFFQNEYGLKKLEILRDLKGLKYKDLPPKPKRLLGDGLMRINVIKNDSHPDIKYDIFMRLNKGAVSLNYQELRNCLFRGNLNDVGKEIVKENQDFLEVLNLKNHHPRFIDVEFIIRFYALSENLMKNNQGDYYISNYRGRMVTYINEFMKKNTIQETDKGKYKNKFNETIRKVIEVFGKDLAFRDPVSGKTKVNKAIADFIMLSFEKFSLETLNEKRQVIQTTLYDALERDEEFRNSISSRTSDTSVLNYRINFWLKELEHALSI